MIIHSPLFSMALTYCLNPPKCFLSSSVMGRGQSADRQASVCGIYFEARMLQGGALSQSPHKPLCSLLPSDPSRMSQHFSSFPNSVKRVLSKEGVDSTHGTEPLGLCPTLRVPGFYKGRGPSSLGS